MESGPGARARDDAARGDGMPALACARSAAAPTRPRNVAAAAPEAARARRARALRVAELRRRPARPPRLAKDAARAAPARRRLAAHRRVRAPRRGRLRRADRRRRARWEFTTLPALIRARPWRLDTLSGTILKPAVAHESVRLWPALCPARPLTDYKQALVELHALQAQLRDSLEVGATDLLSFREYEGDAKGHTLTFESKNENAIDVVKHRFDGALLFAVNLSIILASTITLCCLLVARPVFKFVERRAYTEPVRLQRQRLYMTAVLENRLSNGAGGAKLGTASVRQKDFRLYRINHLLETILTCGFKPIVKKETNPKLLKGKGHSAKVLPYDILVSPFQIVDILINFVVRLKLTDSLAEFMCALPVKELVELKVEEGEEPRLDDLLELCSVEKVKFDEEYQRFCIKHGLTRQPIDEKAEKTLRKFDLRIVTRESMTTSVITNLRLKGAGVARGGMANALRSADDIANNSVESFLQDKFVWSEFKEDYAVGGGARPEVPAVLRAENSVPQAKREKVETSPALVKFGASSTSTTRFSGSPASSRFRPRKRRPKRRAAIASSRTSRAASPRNARASRACSGSLSRLFWARWRRGFSRARPRRPSTCMASGCFSPARLRASWRTSPGTSCWSSSFRCCPRGSFTGWRARGTTTCSRLTSTFDPTTSRTRRFAR